MSGKYVNNYIVSQQLICYIYNLNLHLVTLVVNHPVTVHNFVHYWRGCGSNGSNSKHIILKSPDFLCSISQPPNTHSTLTCSNFNWGSADWVFPQGAGAMWPICFCLHNKQVLRSWLLVLHLTRVLECITAQSFDQLFFSTKQNKWRFICLYNKEISKHAEAALNRSAPLQSYSSVMWSSNNNLKPVH